MKRIIFILMLLLTGISLNAGVHYVRQYNTDPGPHENAVKSLKIRAKYYYDMKYIDYLEHEFENDSVGIELAKESIKLSVPETKRFLINNYKNAVLWKWIFIGFIILFIVVPIVIAVYLELS